MNFCSICSRLKGSGTLSIPKCPMEQDILGMWNNCPYSQSTLLHNTACQTQESEHSVVSVPAFSHFLIQPSHKCPRSFGNSDSDFNSDVNPIKTKNPIGLYSNSKAASKYFIMQCSGTLKSRHFFESEPFSKHLVAVAFHVMTCYDMSMQCYKQLIKVELYSICKSNFEITISCLQSSGLIVQQKCIALQSSIHPGHVKSKMPRHQI